MNSDNLYLEASKNGNIDLMKHLEDINFDINQIDDYGISH